MCGLIWKDFLVLRKTLRLYVLFLLGYLGMALLGIFDLTFVTTFCSVILMILPISAFSYDEFARWDRYARTLPLSTRQLVGGRYLFVLLLMLAVAAIGAVSAVLLSFTGSVDLWESLGTQLVSLGAALFIVDVMFPLNYRLGPERARPFLFAVTFLPFILLFLLAKADILDLSFLDRLQPSQARGGVRLVPWPLWRGWRSPSWSPARSRSGRSTDPWTQAAALAGAAHRRRGRPAPLHGGCPPRRAPLLLPAGAGRGPAPSGQRGVNRIFFPPPLHTGPFPCYNRNRIKGEGARLMTAQNAIHELKQVRQYCSARAIPAIDYAIQVLQGLAEREKRVEEAKQAGPQGPQDPAETFPD